MAPVAFTCVRLPWVVRLLVKACLTLARASVLNGCFARASLKIWRISKCWKATFARVWSTYSTVGAHTDGVTVPVASTKAGQSMAMSTYGMARDPQIWCPSFKTSRKMSFPTPRLTPRGAHSNPILCRCRPLWTLSSELDPRLKTWSFVLPLTRMVGVAWY